MKKLRIVSLLLCILLLLPGAAWAEETGTGFPDVSADAWYAFYVRELAAGAWSPAIRTAPSARRIR